MVKFVLFSACLLAVVCVQCRKVPLSPLALKYKTLNYFENDPDIHLDDASAEDNTPVPYTGDNKVAKIVNQENYQRGKGKFKYALNTENGISVQQAGKLRDDKTFVVQGSYSYTGADGRRYRVRYTADEFGYHPKTELEIDLPDEETNQNDIPDVSPFKTKLDAIRVQKQTPRPISPSNEGVTVRPFGPSAPPAPVISSAPVSPYNLLQGQADPHGNPFGSPGPFVGANYLPPNDYLPPGNAPPPARAISSGHGDYLAPPSDYENQITAAAASASASVFKYV